MYIHGEIYTRPQKLHSGSSSVTVLSLFNPILSWDLMGHCEDSSPSLGTHLRGPPS